MSDDQSRKPPSNPVPGTVEFDGRDDWRVALPVRPDDFLTSIERGEQAADALLGLSRRFAALSEQVKREMAVLKSDVPLGRLGDVPRVLREIDALRGSLALAAGWAETRTDHVQDRLYRLVGQMLVSPDGARFDLGEG